MVSECLLVNIQMKIAEIYTTVVLRLFSCLTLN